MAHCTVHALGQGVRTASARYLHGYLHASHVDPGFRFVKLMGEFSVLVAPSTSNLSRSPRALA